MSEGERGARERSGCALVLGLLLIGFGIIFLAYNLNLVDWSALAVLRRAAVLFAGYWPLILVAWGAFKVFRHFTAPERTRVGFFEVVLLLFVIGCGLTLRTAHRVMSEVSIDGSFDPFFELVELEILGAPAHRFTEERTFSLDPSTAALSIENGTGEVEIVGIDSDRIDVVLTKRVHHLSESDAARLAEEVSLDFATSSDRARLQVRVPASGSRVGTDLTLTVPRRLALALSNRRGGVSLRTLAGLADVETSNGEIDARDLEGGLRAKTSHARIRAENVSGKVELSNRNGAIDARHIRGDLSAVTSHGRVVVGDVQGSVSLENRNSSVRAERVSGSLDVKGEHVEVAAESIGGAVTIRTSHEAIFIKDVELGATIDSRHAAIQVLNVGKDVDVSGFQSPVTIARVGGSARVTSRPSEVTVDDVSGSLTIEGADERVRVSNFRSRLEIRTTHAEIVVATPALGGDVALETTYGNVELRLPRNASARILARTRDGDFRSELSAPDFLEKIESGERTWEGAVGSGAHAVEISTRHGDVRLRESP